MTACVLGKSLILFLGYLESISLNYPVSRGKLYSEWLSHLFLIRIMKYTPNCVKAHIYVGIRSSDKPLSGADFMADKALCSRARTKGWSSMGYWAIEWQSNALKTPLGFQSSQHKWSRWWLWNAFSVLSQWNYRVFFAYYSIF